MRGGRTYGPPANWDREAQGDCLSLSVLTMLDDGGPIQFTAWELGETELAALQAGGHLWLGDVLPMVHVRRIFVQDAAGDTVGELLGSVLGVREVSLEKHRADHSRALTIAAALRSAIIAAGIELETRVRGGGMVDDWTGADNAGIVERLAELVRLVPPASDTVRIPLLKLEDVARKPSWMPDAFLMSAKAVDPATRSELERRLGVELNQPGIAPDSPLSIDQQADAYAAEYVMTTEGSDYEPTQRERELIADALHGFIAGYWTAGGAK